MLDDQDEDVRIAVRALGDMRSGAGSGGTDSRAYSFHDSAALHNLWF